jgi:hypothetical protein
MSTEEWRSIPDHPEYEASNQGRVRSWRTYNRPVVPYLMTPTLAPNGYYYVKLIGPNGKACNPTLHSLVAAAFIGPRPAGVVVRHLDGDSTNCLSSNLAHGTPSDNLDDSVRHGTHPEARKTECKRGHEFTPENTRIEARPNGRSARRCLTCQREYGRARYAGRKSVAA